MSSKRSNVRWGIAVLIGIGIVINYFDRTNISVATKPLMSSYHLTKGEMGILLSSFAWSYALVQIPVGALLDQVGVKWLMRIGTLLWSLATFLTAVVSGMGLIIFSRILLGIAEGPAFPGASKATGYWFPIIERGRATSMFDAAAKLSNVIGVPIVAFAVTAWGWRGGFILTGILSLLYFLAYWIWYRDPEESKSINEAELRYIREGGAQEEGEAPGGSMRNLGYLLGRRKVWGLTIGFAAYGYAFYLFLTWLPGYLETQMHMSVLKSSGFAIIPWVVATLTDLWIGGWLVDKLVASGRDGSRVRKTLLVIGMIFGLAVAGAAFTSHASVAIVWISIALGGLAFSAPIGWSIPALIAPKGTVGTVGSIMNFVNNIMGILAPIITGFIAGGTGSFALGFLVAAVVLLIGILSYVFLLGRIEPMECSQISRL
ncbi:MFS transporter [Alicyclobacillus tolerans]|uniref:Sugar phosphate permease n=2 Tax=Alicyclobacillus tolerans TaxID=90970 RepID=A0A1M6NEB7_9BACL|nr:MULTISPECIES: MFS transporter [Alicyclobacillus]MDP9728332.1 sugar phosphate permease [Alicyclobacillus tengchongensis]SHJ94088.1 Sugar phosphate permease [Alicyclobacillus montanus]